MLTHRPNFLPCPSVCLTTFLESIELWLTLVTVSGSDLDHGCALLAWLPCLISYSSWTYWGSGLVIGLNDCHHTCPSHLARVCGIVPLSVRSVWLWLLCSCVFIWPPVPGRAAFSCCSLALCIGHSQQGLCSRNCGVPWAEGGDEPPCASHSAPIGLAKANTIPLHAKTSAKGEHSAPAEIYF